MATIPSISLIPSGYKASKVYSVLPTDGSADFDFSRNTTATRINKDGLIENVGNNVPRLDYEGGGCPSLLLEPQSTNSVAQSEEFSGTLIGVTVLRNQTIAPSGIISADKLSDNSASGEHLINSSATLSMVSGTSYSFSAFFKADGTSGKGVLRYYNGSTFHFGVFNLDDGVVSYNSNGTSKIEAYSNGWYRCSISFTAGGTYSNPPVQIGIGNSLNQFAYQGASSLGVSFWGVQMETQSYPTSYIPTSGSTQTRLAETANGAGNSSTFNDSEGVLFADISAWANDETLRKVQVNDNTGNNNITIDYYSSSNSIRANLWNGSSQYSYIYTLTDVTLSTKVAFLYKSSEFKFYVNGIKVNESSSGSTFPSGTLKTLDLSTSNGSSPFYGKTKQIQYYNTALTDLELETLTSYTSFNAMALAQNYTI